MKAIIGAVGVVAVGVLAWVIFGMSHSGMETKMKETPKISVVTSFYPLYFFAHRIGGDKADVTNITPAGSEPHDYEPTPQDMAKIEKSQLVVLNGGHLEAWGDDVEKNIDPKNTAIVVAGEGLTTQQVEEEGETITDPHVWLSPLLAEKMVDKITEGFVKADMGNKDYYQANGSALKQDLARLDTAYRSGLTSCQSKDIITSHAAFGYLATTYGLNQVPIAGLSPDAEPSSQELIDIAAFAKKNNVKYIFFESLVSPKLAQTVATEVGAQTLVLNPIEGLTDEELAENKTYLTEMQSNLDHLKIALRCNQ